MNLLFVTEARFVKLKDGSIYGEGASSITLWKRYLKHFNHLYVIARIKDIDNYDELNYFSSKCDFNGVTFLEIPYYVGPIDYFKKRKQISEKISAICNEFHGVFLLRVPGNLGDLFSAELRKSGVSYGIEVVGDPWDVFNPKHFKNYFAWFFRIKGYLDLKRTVKFSSANLYVTQETLQKRYPAKNNAFSLGVSDVYLGKDVFALLPKIHDEKKDFNLISIGSLEQLYKSPDLVLRAIKLLKNEGIMVKLVWLGEGKYLDYLNKLAKELDIEDCVNFKGNVEKEKVYEELKKSDLFLLVSKTEGMPRALIEAMSQGLPCIGSNVGGIPELVQEELLLKKQKHYELACLIKRILTDKSMYDRIAKINLDTAKEFSIDLLDEKRQKFFDYLKNNL